MTAPAPLGPGDDDGKARGQASALGGPLAPGAHDDKHRGEAATVEGPAAPGAGGTPGKPMWVPRPAAPGQ